MMKTQFLIAVCLALAGCVPSPRIAADGDPFTGVTWRLVEFESSDDAIGTIRPHDRDAYTMTLSPDGRASLRLNCNRATGPWSVSRSSDPFGQFDETGAFELGPLAMTRALCPEPSMDVKIARDAEYIRTYVLKDGRLYLALMADGGIYVWEPVP